jgi:AAA15 family ATPase/GTPase
MEASELRKLRLFITPNRHFITEQDTLYCLVYIRKYLERTNTKDSFKILVFYSDWALHPSKERNINHIEAIIEQIQNEMGGFSKKGDRATEDFIEMNLLKSEISVFLTSLNLIDFTENPNKWLNFRNNLIKVLADSPLKVKRNMYLEITYKEQEGDILSWAITYQ